MRITTQIMQNNSLSNLNSNKILQDNLNTQITTQKKITRPSDDPVIAIRALRLRTNLSEITQYLGKNVEDAESWVSATEDALKNVSSVLEDMYKQCESGSSKSLNSENRAAILEQLKGLRDEVYSTGDADLANRTLFTGYRTDTKLRFQENTTDDTYRITENFTADSLSSMTYVNMADLADINTGNYDTSTTTENDITTNAIARIRLAYDSLDAVTGTTTNTADGSAPSLSINGIPIAYTATGATPGTPTEITFANGTTLKLNFTTVSSGASPSAYDTMNTTNAGEAADEGTAIYVPETGEILISNNLKTAMQNSKGTTLSADYNKSDWESGDLRPEHYFKCTENKNGKDIAYSGEEQYMEYDVGYNQTMRVNTLASEVFSHDIGRIVDELMQASQDVVDIEATITKLTAMVDDSNYDQTEVKEKLAAAEKAQTYLKDKEQKLYASGMTSMQDYMSQTNLATTNLGNRDARLALIKTRLTSQQTNFKGLVTENEGADVTEVAVQLKSASTAYDAALLATSKIVQNSLMNYI